MKALEANVDPVAGAVVNASNVQQTFTDTTGIAEVQFGAADLHMLTAIDDNRVPFTISRKVKLDPQ